MKSLYDYIKESGEVSEVDLKVIAKDILDMFKSDLKKPVDHDLTDYIDKNKSKYTGRGNHYDIEFTHNYVGAYRKKFDKYAQEFVSKYGGSFRKDAKYKGRVWQWAPESCLCGPNSIFRLYFGCRIGNTRSIKDVMNHTYISTNNKELWDLIVTQL